jgi:hypothetical protein
MEPSSSQFPESLSGFQRRSMELPDQKSFSDAALAGHKKTKFSPNVTVIEPRGGVISAVPQEQYNRTSTDLANMRKSGEAAKYGAKTAEFNDRVSFSPFKKEKEVIKINSGKAK